MRTHFASRSALTALLALARAGRRRRQDRRTGTAAERPRPRPLQPRRDPDGSGRGQGRGRAAAEGRPGRRGGRSRCSTSAPQDKRGINVFETTKDPGVEFTGFKLDFGAAFTSQIQDALAQQHRRAECGQRRQREPARRHRLRLQQLDRQPLPQRAARARHPRRADQLPVVAPPQRDVGQGRLHPDRRVADRLGAAEDADARSSRSASATSRSTTATRTSAAATTATRSTTRSSATTSWTPSRPRSAARSTSRPASFIAMGVGDRRRNPRHGAHARPARRRRYIGKLGFDRQVQQGPPRPPDGLDVSAPTKAMSNTLYGGDRAGSRYYYVMENTAATETGADVLGLHQPGLQEQGHGAADQPVREVPRARAVRRPRAGEGQALDRDRPSAPGTSTPSTRSTASCPTRSCSSARATTRPQGELAGVDRRRGRQPLAARRRLVHHRRACWPRPST